MGRVPRVDVGGEVYHVINRANGRQTIFHKKDDYLHFEQILAEARELIDMRILAYILMPNHWHFVLLKRKIEEFFNILNPGSAGLIFGG